MLSFLLLFIAASNSWGDIESVKVYQPVPGEGMVAPHCMTWSNDGRLFLAERYQAKIHIWHNDGTFLKTIGNKGQGPGEFTMIQRMVAQGSQLWVCDSFGRRVNIFDLDGNHLKSFSISTNQIEAFAPLNEQLSIICYGKWKEDRFHRDLTFSKWNSNDGDLGELMKFYDEARLPDHKRRIYGPHPVIQWANDNKWIVGYSNSNELWVLDDQAKVLEKRMFDFPKKELPTPDELDHYKSATFVGSDGQVYKFYDPSFMILDLPKAYYNDILVKDKKIFFLLNIHSGFFGAIGYERGTFFVCDNESGANRGNGFYKLPEESVLLTGNGHAIAAISTEDHWEVHEIRFKIF